MDNRKETGNGILNILQLIGYSNKLIFKSNADNIVDKILGGKTWDQRMLKKWIYACLAGIGGSSTVLRTAVVALQLPVLPKCKQYNKKQNK